MMKQNIWHIWLTFIYTMGSGLRGIFSVRIHKEEALLRIAKNFTQRFSRDVTLGTWLYALFTTIVIHLNKKPSSLIQRVVKNLDSKMFSEPLLVSSTVLHLLVGDFVDCFCNKSSSFQTWIYMYFAILVRIYKWSTVLEEIVSSKNWRKWGIPLATHHPRQLAQWYNLWHYNKVKQCWLRSVLG